MKLSDDTYGQPTVPDKCAMIGCYNAIVIEITAAAFALVAAWLLFG